MELRKKTLRRTSKVLKLASAYDLKEIQKIFNGFQDIYTNMDGFRSCIKTDPSEATALNLWMSLLQSVDLDKTKDSTEAAFVKLYQKYDDISFSRKALILKTLVFNSIKEIKYTKYELSFINEANIILAKALLRFHGCLYSSSARSIFYYMNEALKTAKVGNISEKQKLINATIFDSISDIFYILQDSLEISNTFANNYLKT